VPELTTATPQLKAAYALRQARSFRHHPDCRCGVYGGYCNPDDELWCHHMDRELERLNQRRKGS